MHILSHRDHIVSNPIRYSIVPHIERAKQRRLVSEGEDDDSGDDESESDIVVQPIVEHEARDSRPDDSFSEFAWETTLHGVKRISHSSFKYQRVFWGSLFALCLFGAIWQLKNKIISYIKTPVVLDIDREYKTEMEFPAVLVCNANLFRITRSVDPQWAMYDVIHEMYNGSITMKEAIDNKYPHLNLVDMDGFYQEAAHQKDDLIQYCRWPDGRMCNHTDFELVFTDYGVCYAVNMNKQGGKRYNVTHPGSDHGLYLVLNTEDYEAMPGPQQTVGIKVLIYDPNKYPLVSEEGFDVAPGFQTSVGVAYHQTERLPVEDGGSCYKEWDMKYFPDAIYSRKLCIVNKRFTRMVEECACLPMHIKTTDNFTSESMRPCTAAEYVKCIEPEKQKTIIMTEEDCPHQCISLDYQEFVSFSYLATSNINNVIPQGQRDIMVEKFLNARETRSRFDYAERDRDRELLQAMDEVLEKIMNASLRPETPVIDSVDLVLLESTCLNGSMRRLLDHESFCIMDKISKFNNQPSLKHDSQLSKDVFMLYQMINQTQDSLETLHHSMVSEMSVGKSKNGRRFRRSEMRSAIQEELRFIEIRSQIREIRSAVNRYIASLEGQKVLIMDLLEKTENNTVAKNLLPQNITELVDSTLSCLRELGGVFPRGDSLQRHAFPSVRKIVGQSSKTSAECAGTLKELHSYLHDYESKISNLNKNYLTILEEVEGACKVVNELRFIGVEQLKPIIPPDRYDAEDVIWWQERFRLLKATKAMFAQDFLKIVNKPGFPVDIKTQIEAVAKRVDKLDTHAEEAGAALEKMLSFFNDSKYSDVLMDVFEDRGETLPSLVMQAQSCIPELEQRLKRIKSKALGLLDQYMKTIEDIRVMLTHYNDSLIIDDEFYRRNLLALNIYLQEMSIGILRQIKSYDAFSLLCDVGGTLGLFLGASVLTLAEVVEWVAVRAKNCLCCNFLDRRRHSTTATTSVKENVANNHVKASKSKSDSLVSNSGRTGGGRANSDHNSTSLPHSPDEDVESAVAVKTADHSKPFFTKPPQKSSNSNNDLSSASRRRTKHHHRPPLAGSGRPPGSKSIPKLSRQPGGIPSPPYSDSDLDATMDDPTTMLESYLEAKESNV